MWIRRLIWWNCCYCFNRYKHIFIHKPVQQLKYLTIKKELIHKLPYKCTIYATLAAVWINFKKNYIIHMNSQLQIQSIVTRTFQHSYIIIFLFYSFKSIVKYQNNKKFVKLHNEEHIKELPFYCFIVIIIWFPFNIQ